MSRYKNKLLKDGGAMQPCPEYTNSELNHFLALAVIFNKNYKEPRGRGGVFKKKKKKKRGHISAELYSMVLGGQQHCD